jgi:hypothetical protein
MHWTPNKVTALRVAVGFAAVSLFGRGPWANLAAVGLTVTAIALDALDGHIARRKNLATPVGAQLDILGDRMISQWWGWCRCGCPFSFLLGERQQIFCAAWRFAPVTLVGARTRCCKRGGDAR